MKILARVVLLLCLMCAYVHGSPPFVKMFDGECGGAEIRMYEGNGDNPGTKEQRAARCSEACLSKKKALSGSWTGFTAKGFVAQPTTGRCYCESTDSKTCTKNAVNAYIRYDWPCLDNSQYGAWPSSFSMKPWDAARGLCPDALITRNLAQKQPCNTNCMCEGCGCTRDDYAHCIRCKPGYFLKPMSISEDRIPLGECLPLPQINLWSPKTQMTCTSSSHPPAAKKPKKTLHASACYSREAQLISVQKDTDGGGLEIVVEAESLKHTMCEPKKGLIGCKVRKVVSVTRVCRFLWSTLHTQPDKNGRWPLQKVGKSGWYQETRYVDVKDVDSDENLQCKHGDRMVFKGTTVGVGHVAQNNAGIEHTGLYCCTSGGAAINSLPWMKDAGLTTHDLASSLIIRV